MIKIILSSLIFVNLMASGIIPIWYPVKNNDIVIKYGDGISLEAAKIEAFNNIKKDNPILDNITLSDLEIKKYEMIENHFFVKVEYSKQPLIERLKNTIEKTPIKDINITNVYTESNETTVDTKITTNKYLLNTQLLQELNTIFGYFPDLRLDTQYLYFQDERFLVKDSEFSLLLTDIKSEDILLDLKKDLKNNEKYFIKLSPIVDGFITLVQISNNTDVEVLFSNKMMIKDKFTIFPNFKLSDGLEIVLPEDVNSSKIMTMAVLCENQKNFSNFNNMFFSVTTKKYMLGELINEIDGCEYTSVLTTVEK